MGKYFKYAIGEILLVVIGILIALQVNNWNEFRKEKLAEQKILNEILIDLELAKEDLLEDIETNKQSLKATEDLKQCLINRNKSCDSIVNLMNDAHYITQFYPRTAGYQSLNSKGLDLISNDRLLKSIINLFDLTFEMAINEGREYNKWDNSAIDLDEYLRKHLIIDPEKYQTISLSGGEFEHSTHSVMIKDFEALFNDDRFITMLNKSIYGRVYKIGRYLRTLEETNIVSEAIANELDRF